MFNDLNPVIKKQLTDATTVAGSATVGTSAQRILSYNTDRRLATIVNNSASDIYIGFGSSVTINSGIRLNALGGAFEFGLFTTYPWLGEIWAISSSSTASLTFVEA